MTTEPEPIEAEKPTPRTSYSICGRCWCVVADLEQHTAAAHSEEAL